ncbi:hypothetical protein [Olsenella massiliensis]|uniref:hypothetical protein n=1 Tax=Olsenella massiliensis TaxID=1622075 RepID=UPI00071D463E|nr:hypothetical protein [Olsenella massiliensis]
MATDEISGDALDAYLLQPDCPQCGSDDVELLSTMSDGGGGTICQYVCRRCGHVWAETRPGR